MCGAGLGLVFSANGSTGGMDIIGAVINKYKNISIGRILLFCDFFIISSSFFLFHNVDKIFRFRGDGHKQLRSRHGIER